MTWSVLFHSNSQLRSRCPEGRVTQNNSCSPGFGAEPQQAENAQLRRGGSARFSHMARHRHCLRLLPQIGILAVSNASVCGLKRTKSAILPFATPQVFDACWCRAPSPGDCGLSVCVCAIYNRFLFQIGLFKKIIKNIFELSIDTSSPICYTLDTRTNFLIQFVITTSYFLLTRFVHSSTAGHAGFFQ